ncbi:uncharacterized protein LOC108597781 [Drosophila busckii]|uniref:uncharacterized protein LOC108597781 n=1 Tax=Drosophila busckii TaxID=30019 RepID=UPI00083EA22F|nr:uncharacterized protein LOC108597781 [Drosophila busckii]
MQMYLESRLTRMMALKRQIKKGSEQLEELKRRAKRRHGLLQKIRDKLLNQLNSVVDEKLTLHKLAYKKRTRHTLHRMLDMYSKWVKKWQEHLTQQRRQINEKQQQGLQLKRQLKRLTKQFWRLPNAQQRLEENFQNVVQVAQSYAEAKNNPHLQELMHIEVAKSQKQLLKLMSEAKQTKSKGKRKRRRSTSATTSKIKVASELEQMAQLAKLADFTKLTKSSKRGKKKSRQRARKPSKLQSLNGSLKHKPKDEKRLLKSKIKDIAHEEKLSFNQLAKAYDVKIRDSTLTFDIIHKSKKADAESITSKTKLRPVLSAEEPKAHRTLSMTAPTEKFMPKSAHRISATLNPKRSVLFSENSSSDSLLDDRGNRPNPFAKQIMESFHGDNNGFAWMPGPEQSMEQFRALLRAKLNPLSATNLHDPTNVSVEFFPSMLGLVDEVRHKTAVGRDLFKNLNQKQKGHKHRKVQMELKDAILATSVLDLMADKERIVQTVETHYMWDNLAQLNEELQGSGLSKERVANKLKEQYNKYITQIVTDELTKGAKAVVPKEKFLQTPRPSNAATRRSFNNLPLSSDEVNKLATYFSQPRLAQTVDMQNTNDHQQQKEKELAQQMSEIRRRRLFNRLSECESSFSSVDIDPEEARRTIEMRYSADGIMSIWQMHVEYFDNLEMTPLQQRLQERKEYKAALRHEKRAAAKRKRLQRRQQRLQQRPLERLFYEPRRTHRLQQSLLDEQPAPAPEPSACPAHSCIRCGACMSSSPRSSRSHSSLSSNGSSSCLSLSKQSLLACSKNSQLLRLTADICSSCGFVHDAHSACPLLGSAPIGKELQQLRLIASLSCSRSGTCS